MKILRAFAFLFLFASVLGGVSGCGASETEAVEYNCSSHPIKVLATVNQWGSLAKELGGKCVDVSVIINSTGGDPHSFEPAAADVAAFSGSNVVIKNGAGYDSWADKALVDIQNSIEVIDIAQACGVNAGSNPHIWYSIEHIQTAAEVIMHSYKAPAPNLNSEFTSLYETATKNLDTLKGETSALAAKLKGKSFASTESIADYLLSSMGLKNATPEGYAKSAANEGEASASDIAAFSALLKGKKVNALVVNIQEENNTINQLIDLAKAAKIPIISVSEQMPEEFTSLDEWLKAIIKSVSKNLDA